jgi:large subunit ribosomal protein L24
MKTFWSPKWKASKKPGKQRKYRYNAPLHIKGKFVSSHLAKELRQKYKVRSLRVRKGDKVKVLVGKFKGQSGKVERVDIKKSKIYIAKMELIKKDGTKKQVAIEPSNVMITELYLDDKRRFATKKE